MIRLDLRQTSDLYLKIIWYLLCLPLKSSLNDVIMRWDVIMLYISSTGGITMSCAGTQNQSVHPLGCCAVTVSLSWAGHGKCGHFPPSQSPWLQCVQQELRYMHVVIWKKVQNYFSRVIIENLFPTEHLLTVMCCASGPWPHLHIPVTLRRFYYSPDFSEGDLESLCKLIRITELFINFFEPLLIRIFLRLNTSEDCQRECIKSCIIALPIVTGTHYVLNKRCSISQYVLLTRIYTMIPGRTHKENSSICEDGGGKCFKVTEVFNYTPREMRTWFHNASDRKKQSAFYPS